MRILVTGLYRSGSTWLFNACRIMANTHTGIKHESVFYQSGVEFPKNAIIKTHYFYSELLNEVDFIVTSTRSTEEVINSMKVLEQRGIESQFENAANHKDVDEFVKHNNLWMHGSAYIMQFGEMMEDKRKVITGLNKAFNMNVDEAYVLDELDKLKAPLQGFDKETFMTSTHFKFIK